jgi:response regulator RpfG family c-di-GMP phosphodiesterase
VTHTRPLLLIVDDEVRILSALRRCLRREGFEILTVERPEDALDVLRERPVDVVLSDHKMPGMSGIALLARAARLRPRARRLLLTGWTEEVPRTELERVGVHALLPKPWSDAELKAALRG